MVECNCRCVQWNLLGNVVAIYDTSGNMVAKYLYDAFGNCTISNETTSYDVANANPIRYRGYYYDDDTGLYYCNARYYSPKWRRFISPDDTAYLDPESVNGLNLYCYCNNDPVNYVDPSGHEFEWWQKILIGTAFIVAGALVTAAIASTGGFAAAFGAALLTSIKATAASAAIGAGIGFAVGAATTGTWQGAMNGMVDGAIDSFMWGGIFAGGAQIMSGIFKGYAQIANHFGKLKQVKSSPIFSPDRLKGATEIANIASKGQRFHDYGGTIIGFSKNIHLDASTRSLLHLAFYIFPHVPVGTVLAGIIGGF